VVGKVVGKVGKVVGKVKKNKNIFLSTPSLQSTPNSV
jgi:hypothetical protein